jgi:glutamyl-tRNA reductase
VEASLLIVGVNHRTAAVAVRERLAYADEEIVPALARLRVAAPALREAALLSTCNRVEVVAVAAEPEQAAEEVIRFLSLDRDVERASFAESIYRLDGREAARHLFRVGASLDSMVVGEPQILGQLKIAYAQTAEASTIGPVLHRAFHKAFSVAKRVRKSTMIGHGSVSVASAAVTLANQIFDTLADKTVMLMGAGKMAELCARQLKSLGIESLLITSRTFDRAVSIARELGGTAVPFDSYKPYLRIADIVIGSLATTKPVLVAGEFESVVRERRYRPVFLIDLGVPRNFDERLNALSNVYLYDIDDLGQVVDKSRGEREREAEKAEQIVELEVESFWRWMNGLDLVPAIRDIRTSMERLREQELARHRGWLLELAPEERERVELVTRGLVNKVLHRILAGLRRREDALPDGAYAEIARRLLCDDLSAEPGEAADDNIDDDDDAQ